MSNDLSLATNHWRITNPEWGENQNGWLAIFGCNYYLKYKRPNHCSEEARYLFCYPKTAEHYYALYWWTSYNDIIFASYDLEEVKSFIRKLQFKSYFNFSIRDLPTKEKYKIVGDCNNFIIERIYEE